MATIFENVFKCVVVRDKKYRTAFYSHTAALAKREARVYVHANKDQNIAYEITQPVQVFVNRPYI